MALTRLALRLASQEAVRPAAQLSAAAWAASTAYAAGAQIVNGGNVYRCLIAGTSAAAPVTGPAGTGGDIADGSARWSYVSARYPTLAGKLVFDSAFDPVDDLDPGAQQPVVVIYTEDENGDPKAAGGGPPFLSTVDLCFEVSVVVSAQAPGSDEYVAFYPQTDGELEASLDLLEAQVLFALFYGPTGALWRDLTKRRVSDLHSLPHHTGEERIKLARRTLRMKVTVQEDIYDPAPLSDPAGLDRLPQPLQKVVKALVANGYGAKLGAGIAPAAPVMPTAVPLVSVGLNQSTAAPDGSFAVGGSGAPIIDTPNQVTGLDQ